MIEILQKGRRLVWHFGISFSVWSQHVRHLIISACVNRSYGSSWGLSSLWSKI